MVRSASSPAENKASFLRELSEGCVVKKETGLGSMTRFAEVMISHVFLTSSSFSSYFSSSWSFPNAAAAGSNLSILKSTNRWFSQ